jgi:hypothetical protein
MPPKVTVPWQIESSFFLIPATHLAFKGQKVTNLICHIINAFILSALNFLDW